MKLGTANTIIAAALTVSLAGFAIPALAQYPQATRGRSYQVAQAEGSSEVSKESPQAEDQEVSERIETARADGKDVTAAENHQKLGRAAMKSGDNQAARSHFEQAETALGAKEGNNEEHEDHSHEPHEGGTY